mgnify:CR=1 FL=1
MKYVIVVKNRLGVKIFGPYRSLNEALDIGEANTYLTTRKWFVERIRLYLPEANYLDE